MNHSTEQRKGKLSKVVTAEKQADWRDNGKGLRRDVVQNSKEGPQPLHILKTSTFAQLQTPEGTTLGVSGTKKGSSGHLRESRGIRQREGPPCLPAP